MMMERVLSSKLKEVSTVAVGSTAGANQNQQQSTAGMPPVNPTTAAGDEAKLKQLQANKLASIKDPALKTALTKANAGQGMTPQEQQKVAAAAMQTESKSLRRQLYNILRESEVQQAQVVLAAQDMVDEVQKMSEQVSSMQFKDLPALCDQIKNQVGVDQAMQFNTDATAALAGLLQNLQGARQQLDQALGVVTGQAQPQIPGEEDDAGFGGEMDAEPDLGGVDDIDVDVDVDAEEEGPDLGGVDLGREKR
jgi:hypothetical protein